MDIATGKVSGFAPDDSFTIATDDFKFNFGSTPTEQTQEAANDALRDGKLTYDQYTGLSEKPGISNLNANNNVEPWLSRSDAFNATPYANSLGLQAESDGTVTLPDGSQMSLNEAAGDLNFFTQQNGGVAPTTSGEMADVANSALGNGELDIANYNRMTDNYGNLPDATGDTGSWMSPSEAFNATPYAQSQGLTADGNGTITRSDGSTSPTTLDDILAPPPDAPTGSLLSSGNPSLTSSIVSDLGGMAERAGIASLAYDIYSSGNTALDQYNSGDSLGAAQTLDTLAARVGLGLGGSILGSLILGGAAGALLAAESPLIAAAALIGALAGGVGGSFGGNGLGGAMAKGFPGIIAGIMGALGMFPDGSALPDGSYAASVANPFNSSMTDPLVLDMGGNGIQLTSIANSNAYFDLHGTGFAVHTGWVGPQTGLLVDSADPTSINNLFGSQGQDGFAALAALDSNGDGVINASDPAFATLEVWQDANGNGVVDPGEVQTLAQLGITSISLNATNNSQSLNGNQLGATATFTYASGATGQIAEAYFNNSQLDSQFTGSYTLNPDVILLPNLRGYGTLAPLYIAMSMDSTLLGMVQNLAFDTMGDVGSFASQVEAILYQWAGVENVDPASRGPYVDARQLGVLEAFNGESFVSFGTSDNPNNAHQQDVLGDAWNTLFLQAEARLLVQGPLASVFPNVAFNYDIDSLTGTFDWNQVVGMAPVDASALSYWQTLVPVAMTVAQDLGQSADQIMSRLDAAIIAAAPEGAFQSGQYLQSMLPVVTAMAVGLGFNSSDAMNGLQAAFTAAGLSFTVSDILPGNYVFATGDGHPVVNFPASAPGNGALTLDAGTTPSNVTFQADAAGDFTVTLASGDSITFNDALSFTNGTDISGGITTKLGQVDFGDGWDYNLASPQIYSWTGTLADTILTGTNFGNNIFTLGAGGDTVNAAVNSNTFNFDSGDGQATVNFAAHTTGYGILELGADTTLSNVTFQADAAGDLTVTLATGDNITFRDALSFTNGTDISGGITSLLSRVDFGDGWSVGISTSQTYSWTGTATDTTLTGTNFGNNIFTLGAGGDTVNASVNNNTFNFDSGDGQATVNFAAHTTGYGILELGADTTLSNVTFQADAAGDLTVTLASGDSITFNDALSFTNGTDISGGITSLLSRVDFGDGWSVGISTSQTYSWTGTATETTLTGTNFGNNVFTLGAGGDTVNAGVNNNTFNFDSGDGQATVNFAPGTTDAAILDLGPDATPSNVTFQADAAGDLTVTLATSDSITFKDALSFTNGTDISGGITTKLGSVEGYGWGSNFYNPQTYSWTGTATDTTLTGTNFGNNVFTLGAGGDTVNAGVNNNTFNFDSGDGQATVNFAPGTTDAAILDLGPDATPSNVTFQADAAGDLTVTLATGDSITFKDALSFTNGTDISGGITTKLGFVVGYGWGSNFYNPQTYEWTATATSKIFTASAFGNNNIFNLGAAGVALAGDSVAFNGSGEQFTFAGGYTVNVANGLAASIIGVDGTLTVNSPTQDTISWNAGGSVVQRFTLNANGSVKEDDKTYVWQNATGGVLYEQVTTTQANGAVSATISGQGDVSALNNASITLAGGTTATITGQHDTLTESSGGVSVTLSGGSDVITLYGSGNSATLTGSGEQVNDYGTGNDHFSLTGSSDMAVMLAGNSTAALSGANDTAHVYASGDTVNATGASDSLTDYGTGGNAFTLAGTADTIFLHAAGDTATLSGSGDVASLYGTGETVVLTGTGGKVTDYSVGNTRISLGGSGNLATLGSGHDTITVTGTNNTVTDSGTGNDSFSLGGSANIVSVYSAGNTVALTGSNDVAKLYGTGETVTVTGANDAVADGSGGNNAITLAGSGNATSTFRSGDTVALTGNTNNITLYGGGYGMNVTGANDTVNDYGAGNAHFSLAGNADLAVILAANDTVTLAGSGDSAHLYNNGEIVSVTGTNDTVNDYGAGSNAISFSGSGNHGTLYNIGNDTLTIGGASNSVSITGNNTGIGTATLSGTNALLEFLGSSADNIIFINGATGTLKLDSPTGFSGTVAGLAAGDSIDLGNFLFSGAPTISNVTGSGAAGTTTNVTVTDNSHSVMLELLNQYANQFAVSSAAYTVTADSHIANAGTLFQLAAAH